MRKILLALCAVFAAISCAEQIVEPVSEQKPGSGQVTPQPVSAGNIVFDIRVNHPDAQTKAVKAGWETGDIVYVFFNNVEISDTPRYATLTRTVDGWDAAFSAGWNGTGLEESGATMSAVYFPFSLGAYSGYTPIPLQVSKDGSSYTFKAFDIFQGSDRDLGYTTRNIFTYYLKAEQSAYTLTSTSDVTTLSGTLNMTIPDGFVQFYIAADGDRYNENDRYRLAVQKVKPVSCYTLGQDGLFFQKERAYGEPMAGCKYGDGILFSGIIDKSAWSSAEKRRFLLFDTQGPALTRTFTKSLSSHDAVKLPNTGWVRAVPEPDKVDLFGNGNPYVADRNIGAEDLDDFGLYFTYGEIVPWSEDPLWCFKDSPATASNFWCMDGSHLIKYNASCTLDSFDDPATVWLGPGWTTLNNSLTSSVTWSAGWVYPVDGGNKTRSVTGAGGTIYLPAAGYRDNTSFYADNGRYLTPSDNTANNAWGDHQDGARQIFFSETGNDYYKSTRQVFLPVRAVSTVAPEYKNLSALATANTYIVSSAGKYKFKATVKGNGGVDPLTGATATTIDPAGIAGVKVLWEVYGQGRAIKHDGSAYDIRYNDGYVYFSTPDTFIPGDACVAIYDSEGTILWSWLIWATPEPGTMTHNDATFMDRNLGAIDVGNCMRGFCFQWGRKDAFSAADGDNYSPYTYVPAASTVFDKVSGSNQSIEYTVKHPTTFIGNSGDYTWMSEELTTKPWRSDVKTIYDPCPVGWRVPTKENISGISGLPATGIHHDDSGYNDFGNPWTGYYWSASTNEGADDGAWAFCNDGRNLNHWGQDQGYAIRPVLE